MVVDHTSTLKLIRLCVLKWVATTMKTIKGIYLEEIFATNFNYLTEEEIFIFIS